MEVIMANTNLSVKSNKSVTIAAVVGWSIITLAVVGGAGFYLGYQYRASEQAKTHAAVQDALKAAHAPAPVVAANPKN
jgi:uncharacterized protein HemX